MLSYFSFNQNKKGQHVLDFYKIKKNALIVTCFKIRGYIHSVTNFLLQIKLFYFLETIRYDISKFYHDNQGLEYRAFYFLKMAHINLEYQIGINYKKKKIIRNSLMRF